MNTKIDSVTVEVAAHNTGVLAVLLGVVLLGVERVIQRRRMRRVFEQQASVRLRPGMLAVLRSDDGRGGPSDAEQC